MSRITNHESRITEALIATMLLLTVGCKSFRSSNDPVVRDQEIVRDIKWRCHQDGRMDEVRVACEARVVTLTGRVASPEARTQAEEIAAGARDVGRVVNKIEVRAK
jgi:osmotically-inducible protein OsmY